MQKISKNRGITLIALVVTIIVLLILVGIVIVSINGNNGILDKAKLAKSKYQNSANDEMEKLSKYEDYLKISSSRDIKSNSTIIGDFSIKITINSNTFISIKVDNNYTEQTKGYIYFINDKVAGVGTNTEYTYTELTENTDYKLYVIAIDNDGNMKKSNILDSKTNTNLQTRYLLIDVYDHIGGDSTAINELEFYDKNNNLLSYTLKDVYDSSCNGTPFYWNDTRYWMNSNLYDGNILHRSNAEGGQNCTLFFYNIYEQGTSANSGYYARFVVDLGEVKTINAIKMAIGNAESRIPKEISVYAVMKDSYNSESKINSEHIVNLKYRENNNLSLIHTEKFENIITTPTWYSFL